MKKPLLLLWILIFSGLNSICQPVQKKIPAKVSPEELKEDLAALKENLENIHIGLYTYHTKAQFDSAFRAIERSLTEPLSSLEFYRKLSPLLKLIANGHTDIQPPANYFEARRNEHLLFPFGVYWDTGSLYIMRNVSLTDGIKEGSRIDSINGLSASHIFTHLRDQITRDGYNQSMPTKIAQDGFLGEYAKAYGNPEKFVLHLTEPDGGKKILTVDAIPVDSIRKKQVERYGPRSIPWHQNGTDAYTLEIEGKTAIMTLRTFSKSWIRKNGPPYKKFFNTAFKKIEAEKIEHLIIDMRDNGGGDPEPTIKLFAHLHDKPFTFYKGMTTSTKKIRDRKLYDENLFFINTLMAIKLKKQGDVYRVKGVAGLKETQPAKPYYQGKTYILTNPSSFSATGEMTAILKEWDKGVFIGEEAGGNPNQNVSGVGLSLVLPHSQIQVTMPLVLFEMNVSFENTGRGVIPDYKVRKSWKDVLEKRDVVMEFTKELISAQLH